MPTRIDIQHWTGLLPLVRPRTVRIDPALDFRDPLLVTKDHLRYFDPSPDKNRYDGYKPNSQANDRLHHSSLQEDLVELTGIEPVASWLQTRRSPS